MVKTREQEPTEPFENFTDQGLLDSIRGASELGYLGVEDIVQEAKRRRARKRGSPVLSEVISLGQEIARINRSRKKGGK